MNEAMTPGARLDAAFSLKSPDRTPVLGGWIAYPDHIMEITGTDEDQYWNDPQGVSIEAYKSLGSDGIIGVFVPKARGIYRSVDETSYANGHVASDDVEPEPAEELPF